MHWLSKSWVRIEGAGRFVAIAALGFFVWVTMPGSLAAQEVALESCFGLPTMQVSLGGQSYRFLVDTAASSSLLDIKSFPYGEPREESISSWDATSTVLGRKVSPGDLVIAGHRLANLRLAAVDLSRMRQTCGKKIDGILGADLLERLGLEIDIKNRVARFAHGANTTDEAEISEFKLYFAACGRAFDRADKAALADCMDPGMVLFTFSREYHGRDAVMGYFENAYFERQDRPRLVLVARGHHIMGDVLWLEYDLRITRDGNVTSGRGTALFRKVSGKWLMLNMNHSEVPSP